MTDPLEALEESLAYMFELQTRKTGKYINPAVQKLKKALEDFKTGPSLSLSQLISAMKRALPIIENYVDGYEVKRRMETLAEANGLYVVWDTPQIKNRRFPHFQFMATNIEITNNFISWVSTRIGIEFSNLDGQGKIETLLAQSKDKEFTTKLEQFLLANPDFLSNLILESPNNFMQIINTPIGFLLENQYIAKAIAKHSESMLDHELEPQEQVEKYIEFLNSKLAITDRSFEKLLDDPLAKAELDKVAIFQSYQNQIKFSLSR